MFYIFLSSFSLQTKSAIELRFDKTFVNSMLFHRENHLENSISFSVEARKKIQVSLQNKLFQEKKTNSKTKNFQLEPFKQ